MRYKLVTGLMSVFCAIAVTIAQVFATKISQLILWQVYIPIKLVEPSSLVHPGANGETIIEWNPEAQLMAASAGLIFGIALYSYIIYKIINKKRLSKKELESAGNEGLTHTCQDIGYPSLTVKSVMT